MDKNFVLLALISAAAIGTTLLLANHQGNGNVGSFNNNLIQEWKKFKVTYHKRFSDPDEE